MSAEDVLPTYAEAMRFYQTPASILRNETAAIIFAEPSTISTVKSAILRKTHDDEVGAKNIGQETKSKVLAILKQIFARRRLKQSLGCSYVEVHALIGL